MKITGLTVSEVRVPLLKSYTLSRVGTLTESRSVILEIETDQGVTGVGETDPELMFTGESQYTVMAVLNHHIGPALIGMDPLRIEAVHQRMDRICVGNPFARAAVDMACHDIAGQHLNSPVYQLYGGMLNESIDVMWSLGSDRPEANAEEALEKVHEGYRTIGLKVGALPAKTDVERVRAVRAAVGDEIGIRCDANQAWRPAEAVDIIRRMEAYGISMMEQPTRSWDIKGLARVRSAVNTPIAVDEGMHSARDALRIVQAGAADIFSIKISKMGGLLPAAKAAAIIEAAGHTLFVNSMIELGVSVMAGLHFAVTRPSLFACGQALNSVRRMKDDVLLDPVEYNGGAIVLPAGRTGLGVVLDKGKMKRYTVSRFRLI